MDAITTINARIAEIQSRIAEFDPTRFSPAALSMPNATSAASFESVLAAQTGGVSGASGIGSGLGLVNSENVPVEFLTYGNGRIPAQALSTISGTAHQLWAPAARSFESLRAAAAADGVTIGITDSYRSYDAQVDVAARKGLYSQGGLAATPGTSNHGWGMALDLSLDSGALTWMRQHGGEYGFTEPLSRESWHWEYHPTH